MLTCNLLLFFIITFFFFITKLKINKSTFYKWYDKYEKEGFDGLKRKKSNRSGSWNKINESDRDKVVELALEKPELSSRELAWHITDTYRYYISESSVYRILKANGLITTPSFRIMSASDSFHDKICNVSGVCELLILNWYMRIIRI